jgi:hypothetical protein
MKRTGTLAAGLICAMALTAASAHSAAGAERGQAVRGELGVTRTTAQLEAAPPRISIPSPPIPEPERPGPRHKAQNPNSPAQAEGEPRALRAPAPRAAISGVSSFNGPDYNDSQAFPPDSMGDVGPSQFVVMINGRVRSYNKRTGNADGGIDVDTDVFWQPVMTPLGGGVTSDFTSDPRIRFDRLSGRWIATMIDVPNEDGTQPNRIMIAASDGPTITQSTTWTFHFIQVGSGEFADYPTLGVDGNALYIGTNQFGTSDAFPLKNTNAYVVNKSSILGSGPIAFTAFPASDSNQGLYTPQGVDNTRPGSGPGYFIGVDLDRFGKLDLLRVSNPGSASPTLSAPIGLTVPRTDFPISVPHLGNTGGRSGRLDALDDRLFVASMGPNGHIWTAHNIEVNSSGAAPSLLGGNRDGSRWYEIAPGAGNKPTLVQSGTVFDPASSSPRSYWMPSLAVSGEGIMAIGGSTAGAAAHADAWYAGRLPHAARGTVSAPARYTHSSHAYNPPKDTHPGDGPRRWGDFSLVRVDPDDNQTLWTIQEYVRQTNIWGLRIARLSAPPPATPSSIRPTSIPRGRGSVIVHLRGTSKHGSAFFDPGPDPGGPGFPDHLRAAVSGGVTVNDVSFRNPTHLTLNLNTKRARKGKHSVRIINPDGQRKTGAGILRVAAGPDTRITRHPKRRIRTAKQRVRVRFAFRSEAGAAFACNLDGGARRRCHSPKSYRVPLGGHRFAVRARDVQGNVGPAAKFRFRVVRGR